MLKTLWLSLDPYMRGRMNASASYAPSVELGDVMIGESVCRVEASHDPRLSVGDLVLSMSGWQSYHIAKAGQLRRVDVGSNSPSLALGVLGMPGITAYVGLLDIGAAKRGDTVVVSAAAGGVGSLVGQLAKIQGCRVVGIAGGPVKCAWAVNGLGYDACVDYRQPDFSEQLEKACQNGVDVYFDNVGGDVLKTTWPLLNVKARVVVCGVMSQYNPGGKETENWMVHLMGGLLRRRITMQGFIVYDHYEKAERIQAQLLQWIWEGRLQYREHVVDGLEEAPKAFIELLTGASLGKTLVRVAR